MSAHLCQRLSTLEIRSLPSSRPIQRRYASHQAQGRANKAKQGPGKRLGAKKTGGEYVVTGNILYKQRGTLWFPGENCFMGRDHTIHAATPGYVRYYRDARTERKYIGVAIKKDQVMPSRPDVARVRRLGMLAYQIPEKVVFEEPPIPPRRRNSKIEPMRPKLRPGYQYRIGNWEIGREVERVGTNVVPYQAGNRWRAWRQRTKAIQKAAVARSIGKVSNKKTKKN